MRKERQIEKFISRSVKNRIADVDDFKLQSMLEVMTTEEIQRFWMSYVATRALHKTDVQIPHWKTSEQQKLFSIESATHYYYPIMDENGKSIVVRKDLIDHVKKFISKDIYNSIQTNNEFKDKTFLEKIPFYLLISALIGVPFYVISSLFPANPVTRIIISSFYFVYGAGIVFYPIIQLVIKQKHRKIK